jgi:O-antigen ligase
VIRSVEVQRGDRAILVVAAVIAVTIGFVAAVTTPLIPLGVLLSVLVVAMMWWRPIVGVYLFVLIVALLPFGVIPVSLGGAQMTFVDAIMIGTLSALVGRWIFTSNKVPLDKPGVALIVFALVCVAAFIGGTDLNSITPELVRRTGKLLASLLFFFVARDVLTTTDRLAGMTRALMLAAAVQGAIGTAMMALSPDTQLSLLNQLAVIGYPTDNVLRYVPGPNNTYTDQLRAIGTSVDPNVFGGTLMLALVVIVAQWASPKPVLPKGVLVLLAVPTATGVLLSLSRASWVGFAVGLAFIGVLRYRRILVLGLIGTLCVLATPYAQAFILRFVSGFSTADPATAFRIGEYTNALTLIGRYPFLGIGFGASPDIDVTAGVSSVYLLIGEQTGLVGLSVYLFALIAVWFIGVGDLRRMTDARLQSIRAAFLAAISAALVTGLLDQYFANQAFPHAVALFWLYAAMLVSASRLARAAPAEAVPERAATMRPREWRVRPTPAT